MIPGTHTVLEVLDRTFHVWAETQPYFFPSDQISVGLSRQCGEIENMRTEPRQIRIDGYEPKQTLHSLVAHDHPCLVYETEDELRASFVPYLQSGLLRGERCMYILDENEPDFVMNAMNSVEVKPYVDSGAFQIIRTSDAHLKGGFFEEKKMMSFWAEAIAGAKKDGFKGFRAAVEMTWALSGSPGCDQLVPYESELNNLFPLHEITVLCQYRISRFDPAILKGTIHAHPLVVTAGEVIDNPCYILPREFKSNYARQEVQVLLKAIRMGHKLKCLNEELLERTRSYHELHQELQRLAYEPTDQQYPS